MSAAIDPTFAACLPGRYACVDLETTGADPQFARIIEVGIVLIDDGVITDRWTSLVDPEKPISERIQAFTGITNEMVAVAPTFHQVLDEIQTRCSGRIFAAHNARFDYGFLRAEFARAGKRFDASLLCTVKLSRRLDASVRVHNLDAVIERYGLTCERRHRALPDAHAVADFLLAAASAHGTVRVQQELDHLTRPVILPPQLPASLLDELPDAPGVYCCVDAEGNALQVGRASHLRGAVLSLLTADGGRSTVTLRERVARVDWQRATGEWSAHLLEILWRKQRHELQPKRAPARYTLHLRARGSGPVVRQLDADQLEHCYGEFRTEAMAVRVLKHHAREHQLCLRVLGLDEGEGACVAYQLGHCRGACIGKEPLAVHELRAQLAFADQGYRSWPFAGRVALTDVHEDAEALHVFEQWCYLGTANTEEEAAELARASVPLQFDLRIYRMTLNALQQGRVRARPLSRAS